ncbi:MAG: hypothetical protein JW939_02890, partial [Candidatus Thermoplasmatota archaeon]|nr:hypothetical protein [Candidatus Thermoplasmatota archaeon]
AAVKDFTWKYLLLGDVEFRLNYYRNRFRKGILRTAPVKCREDPGFEVHILTCRRDLLDALWSLKSFYHFNDIDPMLVVHEDGTFDDICAKTFRDHFKGCRIIRLKKANEEMRSWLKGKKYAREYRFERFMFHSLKLFDFYGYSNAESVMSLDSDLLFFGRSEEVLEYLRNNRAFFMSDYRSSYSFDPDELGKELGMDIISHVNSGLMNLPLEQYDPDLLERFLELCHEHDFPHHGWMEQTAHAVLLSKKPGLAHRLSPRHQISFAPHRKDTISHHYVYDGSRKNFYVVGLKRLRKAKFLKSIS